MKIVLGIISITRMEILDNWFSIALQPSRDFKDNFDEFRDIVQNKYIKRKMFLGARYCFEQKGENADDIGIGYHVHILASCRYGLAKTQIIKDTKSTFNKFLKGEFPAAFCEVEYIRTLGHFQNVFDYMSDIKIDKNKSPASIVDRLFRKQFNLDDIYEINFKLPKNKLIENLTLPKNKLIEELTTTDATLLNSEDNRISYIYLIREREFINKNEQVYKIGRTTQEKGLTIERFKAYKKGSEIIFLKSVENTHVNTIENIIKKIFNEKFKKHNDGTEYFIGSPDEMCKIIFNECVV